METFVFCKATFLYLPGELTADIQDQKTLFCEGKSIDYHTILSFIKNMTTYGNRMLYVYICVRIRLTPRHMAYIYDMGLWGGALLLSAPSSDGSQTCHLTPPNRRA